MVKELGEYRFKIESFPQLEQRLAPLRGSEWSNLPHRKRFKRVNKLLLDLIQEAPCPCFLLPAVIDYIEQINTLKVLNEPYTFALFELFLNQYSQISNQESLLIRGKIVGRFIPRNEYQAIFPVGGDTYYPGTHFVAAHLSPDIDTTVASFIGWLDAFGCKVADGLHHWGLPAIPQEGHLVQFLTGVFGSPFFHTLRRPTASLTLTAQDLVTQKDFVKIQAKTTLSSIDRTSHDKALILVDEDGHFVGEWRSHDAEVVRQITLLLSSTLRWFENSFIGKIVKTLAKEALTLQEVKQTLEDVLSQQLLHATPIQEASDKQKKLLGDCLRKVIGVKSGMNASFSELLKQFDATLQTSFDLFIHSFTHLLNETLVDTSGFLTNSRAEVLSRFETLLTQLETAVQKAFHGLDRLDVMLQIRERVLGQPPLFVTLQSDVEELRNKISSNDYMPVVVPEEGGKWFPVGIIRSYDLKRRQLGTASLRDFSNLDEVKLASYIDVISVIDHHKTTLQTVAAATFTVADTQSSNTLVAEINLALNNEYRTASKTNYFVHPTREIMEYFAEVIAILDDTDLLSKVSKRDVLCMQQLLNKLKQLVGATQYPIIDFNDLPPGPSFAVQAAKRLLQHPDLYSIYKKIYEFREEEVARNIFLAAQGKPSSLFADTKEQNNCCRIGQTKLFSKNISLFQAHRDLLLDKWRQASQAAYKQNPHLDFYMQMISTITGGEEVYSGAINWTHKDELWIWSPLSMTAREHLIQFLSGFQSSSIGQTALFDVFLYGSQAAELFSIFERNFPKARLEIKETTADNQNDSYCILQFKAGLLNSRKAHISPYLPKSVP